MCLASSHRSTPAHVYVGAVSTPVRPRAGREARGASRVQLGRAQQALAHTRPPASSASYHLQRDQSEGM